MRRGNNLAPVSGEFEAKPESRDSRRGHSFLTPGGSFAIFVGQNDQIKVFCYDPEDFLQMCEIFDMK
jgi:hypothetical protein